MDDHVSLSTTVKRCRMLATLTLDASPMVQAFTRVSAILGSAEMATRARRLGTALKTMEVVILRQLALTPTLATTLALAMTASLAMADRLASK